MKKNATFPVKKSLGPFFLVVSNIKNVRGTVSNGAEGTLTGIVQANMRSFLEDL